MKRRKEKTTLISLLLEICRGTRRVKKGRKIWRSVQKNKKEYRTLLAGILSLPKRYRRK